MNNIETARKAKGYTRPDLAALLKVQPGTVYAWERMGQLPELKTAIRMADILEVSLDYLFRRACA